MPLLRPGIVSRNLGPSPAGTDTRRRFVPLPNSTFQVSFLSASAMYNNGATALSSRLRVGGPIFRVSFSSP
jgi:hypothetical protein